MMHESEEQHYPDDMPEEVRRALQESLDLSTKFFLFDTKLNELCGERHLYDTQGSILTSKQIKGLIMQFIVASLEQISESALNKVPEEFRPLALQYFVAYRDVTRKEDK